MSEPLHVPVLTAEVLTLLRPERGGVFIDGTLGMGGHAAALLAAADAAGAELRLTGIDRDPYALEQAEKRLGDRVTYLQGTFGRLHQLPKRHAVGQADGILLDIGVSSYQIDTPSRGFSFQADGPLDMRMDPDQGLTAAAIVNGWQEHRLSELLKTGEERLARKIAAAIATRREVGRFRTTADLAAVITEQYPMKARFKRPHPATRTFQALRMEVNGELRELRDGIASALALLAPGGVLAVISFHSLEDRIVKHAFRDAEGFEVLTKRPVTVGLEELAANPRSRSAKLRGIRRPGGPAAVSSAA